MRTKHKWITAGLLGVIITAIAVGVWQFAQPYWVQPTLIANAQQEGLSLITPEEIEDNIARIAEEVAADEDAYTYDIDAISHAPNLDFGAVMDRDALVGEVYMPETGLHVPILEGMTNDNLAVAATTMKRGQAMGEGNYSIAAHYMHDKSLMFTPLENAEPGMKVYVTDKSTVYEYELDWIEVMTPDNGWVASDDVGDGVITMVTCADITGVDRLVAQGLLVDSYPMDAVGPNLQSVFLADGGASGES